MLAQVHCGALLIIIAAILMLLPMIQRLHDLDASGWWVLIALLPIIHPGFMILGLPFGLVLLFAKGTEGANKYGPDPLQKSTR